MIGEDKYTTDELDAAITDAIEEADQEKAKEKHSGAFPDAAFHHLGDGHAGETKIIPCMD